MARLAPVWARSEQGGANRAHILGNTHNMPSAAGSEDPRIRTYTKGSVLDACVALWLCLQLTTRELTGTARSRAPARWKVKVLLAGN